MKTGRSSSHLTRNPWFLLYVALAAPGGAAASESYAVMSLVGDKLTVIASEKQVGSNLDLNRQQVIPFNDRSLDDFAARTADATIERVRPSASVTMLRANDPTLYALGSSWLNADAVDVKTLRSSVAKFVSPSSDTRLLLIAPYRDELELKTDRGYPFTGSKVAGLGLYLGVGNQVPADNRFVNEIGSGYLGVFANFQLVLINLQTSAIEAHERIVAGDVYPSSLAPDRNPINALSQTQKVEALQNLMKREIERVLPGMLGSPKS